MASQHEDSSESDGDTEPAKCFHRRLSTNKDMRYKSFIKEGFLNKQNGSFQRWHKRYFKLKSGVLYYSKDRNSTIFNQIDLIDSSIAERSLKNINHSFQVITPFRNLVLCAISRLEMKEWVEAIRTAAFKDFREASSETADLSSLLTDHHNWCILPNVRPIFCNVCGESLHRMTRTGVTINGLACEVCKFRTHKKCASRSPSTCKWTTLASMGGNIIEDENGDLVMPHQWMMGNFPVSSRCLVCEKSCSSMLKLQDFWCLWCHCTVHPHCKDHTMVCGLGPARLSMLPPISITNFDEGGFWRACKSPNTSPLLVFLNSKSGDSQGVKMLRKFKQLLNPAQVFDLMNGGPKMGLRLFQNFESFRVLVCGGDGSVGWVLNEIDRLGLHKQCQVGVLPLGTGNDLSRVLGWGASFDDDTQLPALLEKLEHAQIQMFDRWSIFSYETDQTRNRSLPIDPICAYEDTASNHLSRILHSESHNVVISSAMVLCSIVQELVSKVGSSIDENEGCTSDKDSIAYKCLMLNQKMEALLKTLAEESTISQSEQEKNAAQNEGWMVLTPLESPPSFASPLQPPLSPPPPTTSLSPPPPTTSLSPPPATSLSSSSWIFGNALKDFPINSHTTDQALTTTSSSIPASSSSPPHPQPSSSPYHSPSSSSSLQRASITTTTCLRQVPTVKASASPLKTSSSLLVSSSSSSPYSSVTAPSIFTFSTSIKEKSPPLKISTGAEVTYPVPKVQRSQRIQKQSTIRSKEQLMCRANSLKKAIRQIVELTEKAVDEQNHQTTQFDKDNERNTHAVTSSPDKTTKLPSTIFISSPIPGPTLPTNQMSPEDDLLIDPIIVCNGTPTPMAPPTSSELGNLQTHSSFVSINKSPSRDATPIIFNYQLCENLPYVIHPPITSSSHTNVTQTPATTPRAHPPNDGLLSPSHLVTTPLATSAPKSQIFSRTQVLPTHHSAILAGPFPPSDIPSVSVVDDSILDNEVSQVMHDVNGMEKNHLEVPGAHSNHHHHQNYHHYHDHHHISSPLHLSPQLHHTYHHSDQGSHHHHHQDKDSSLSCTLIAQHHLQIYSSSDGEASRSSTPIRLTPYSPQNHPPPSLVDRWSPLFGMSADRTNSPSPSFFDYQIAVKVTNPCHSPSRACPSHAGGRHLSSLSTLYKPPDPPPAPQSGPKSFQKGYEGVQFPLLNLPLLQSLPKQVIGKGRKSSPIHSSLISRALMANADALCAPASPLNDLANIDMNDFTEKCVMNNYFGIGLDAKITLDFHNKREEQPHKCRSRTKNMMWYGVLGGKEILQRTHKNLDQKVRLECDGRLIPLPNLQGIVILNIPSYMGGINFWGGSKEDEYFIAPSFDDKVLEVVAVFGSIQLGISRVINIQRHRIAQCRTVRITIIGDEGLPVQVDGEAWIQNPGVVWIQHKNRAQVLIRDRAFEEALKNWTEKQKSERTPSREPPLSQSELASLTTFTEASRDLLEKVNVVTSLNPQLELLPPVQAVKFIDGFNHKMSAKPSRGEVMEFAGHMRSFSYEVKQFISQNANLKDCDGETREGIKNVLEFLDAGHHKVHSIGAQFYERMRNKDRLKFLFKLSKSSRKHKNHLRPDALAIRDWSQEEVAQWLNGLELSEYVEAFLTHDVRGAELLGLGRTDLKELGVSKVGHLKRIQHEIKSMKDSLKSFEGSRVQDPSEDSTTSSHLPSSSSHAVAPSSVSMEMSAALPDVVVTSSMTSPPSNQLSTSFSMHHHHHHHRSNLSSSSSSS